MNNNKCNLLILGKNGVGKTILRDRLTESNLKINRSTKEFSIDLIVQKGSYQVEVEVKERSSINYILEVFSFLISEKYVVIIIVKSTLYQADIDYFLKNLPTSSIVILFFNEARSYKTLKINQEVQKRYSDRIREIIWCDLFNDETFRFIALLENIIINKSTDRLSYAKSLIRNNFISKEKTLDLGNCSITNLIEVEELFNNVHLEELILSNEWAEYRDGKWYKNTSQNTIGRNTLGNIPEAISKLKNLRVLNSGGDWNDGKNKWNRWNITDLKPLLKLPQLEYINLSNNSIEIVPSLVRLKKIKILHLNNNFISRIYYRNRIDSLEELYLSNNNIKSLSFINKLPSVKTIDIHQNDITNLSPIKELIERLNISDSKWKKNTINVAKNPLVQPPMEIVRIGKGAVLNYFEEIASGKSYINKDVKLILVGNSEVGKTTLAKYLNNEVGLDEKHSPTHWMDEKHLKSKNIIFKIKEKCNINLFDFGGHDFFHDTHHLFFGKNTMYLLVWDSKSNKLDSRNVKQLVEEDQIEQVLTQDYPLKYWLDSIRYYTKEKETENFDFEIDTEVEYTSHVVVIQNKVERFDDIVHLNNASLTSVYPFIYDFINISLLPKRNLNYLDSVITDALNETKILGAKLPKYYGTVKESIADYSENPILSISEFRKYCSSITNELITIESATFLANYLNQIGVILYNPSEKEGRKVYIHKKWVLSKIHSILKGLNKLNGEFDNAHLKSIWGNSVTKQESKDIIDLMKEFKIIFTHPQSNRYIAPLYLPSKPISSVSLFIDSNKRPYRKIRYTGFIHKNVILNFFQEYGKLVIKEQPDIEDGLFYYWKDGLVIKDPSSPEIVMIQFNLGDNEGNASIDIIKLNINAQTAFVDEILKYIHQINEGYETEEMVTNNGLDFVPLSTISENEEKENWVFEYGGKYYKLYDFKEYLKTENRMKKIFISYSKQDLTFVNTFIDHLSALKQDGKVSSWYCSELQPGSEWDSEIQKHFSESDIVCFMVSHNFMSTQYIHDYEIAKAFERKSKEDDFKVVPIILDFCRWSTEKNNLSQFTALPYKAKPVADFKNQNMAWYIIEECLRIIIEEDLTDKEEKLFENEKLPKDVMKIYERIIEGKVDDNTL